MKFNWWKNLTLMLWSMKQNCKLSAIYILLNDETRKFFANLFDLAFQLFNGVHNWILINEYTAKPVAWLYKQRKYRAIFQKPFQIVQILFSNEDEIRSKNTIMCAQYFKILASTVAKSWSACKRNCVLIKIIDDFKPQLVVEVVQIEEDIGLMFYFFNLV
jgi:hypothetical protein